MSSAISSKQFTHCLIPAYKAVDDGEIIFCTFDRDEKPVAEYKLTKGKVSPLHVEIFMEAKGARFPPDAWVKCIKHVNPRCVDKEYPVNLRPGYIDRPSMDEVEPVDFHKSCIASLCSFDKKSMEAFLEQTVSDKDDTSTPKPVRHKVHLPPPSVSLAAIPDGAPMNFAQAIGGAGAAEAPAPRPIAPAPQLDADVAPAPAPQPDAIAAPAPAPQPVATTTMEGKLEHFSRQMQIIGENTRLLAELEKQFNELYAKSNAAQAAIVAAKHAIVVSLNP